MNDLSLDKIIREKWDARYSKYYTYSSQQKEFHYEHYGKEITEEQFNQISTEIIEGIDKVIFQGVGDDLYQDYVWYGLTPFEENRMTYVEAVAWLEAQIEMAQ